MECSRVVRVYSIHFNTIPTMYLVYLHRFTIYDNIIYCGNYSFLVNIDPILTRRSLRPLRPGPKRCGACRRTVRPMSGGGVPFGWSVTRDHHPKYGWIYMYIYMYIYVQITIYVYIYTHTIHIKKQVELSELADFLGIVSIFRHTKPTKAPQNKLSNNIK